MLTLLTSMLTALAAGPSASSYKDGTDGRMTADLAFDGLFSTAWVEGAPGYGEGQWLELDLGRPTKMHSISIWPGRLDEGDKSYRESSRPKLIRVLVDDAPQGEPIRIIDGVQRLDVPVDVTGRKVRIEVVEVFEGYVFSDMAIAEVAIDFPDAVGQDRLQKWRASREADRLAEGDKEAMEAAYDAYKEAKFGDSDALATLMDPAADGPAYERAKVVAMVPAGYRAQAIVPSPLAATAIRKLKDPNGIPALQKAALRATGDQKAELDELVEIFYAYQELQSGGNHNVPYWGQTGWEAGALKSYNEPLPVEIDAEGRVYVADVGNNRVQRYGDNGRPEKQWGPEADIANNWFAKTRPWYVSGARPGEGTVEFLNPLDVELIPEKEGTSMAVIDATNRIRIFDPDGRPVISWTVETRNEPEPGLGGQSYLAWLPKKKILLAVIQEELVAFTLDSEERFRFDLEDGTPNAFEALPNGKLLANYHDEIIQYTIDGFRFGTVISGKMLKPGFEDLDMTIDESGKLWVATDTGWVTKFKKPGKVALEVRALPTNLRHPRIAVRDGIMFLTSDDKVNVLDILQIIEDQKQAEELEAAMPKEDK